MACNLDRTVHGRCLSPFANVATPIPRAADSQGESMTPEEFTAKLQEFRAALADQDTQLQENRKWATGDERVEIVHELEELLLQVESLIESLEDEPEDEDSDDDS